MYYKTRNSWTKYWKFILIDLLCLVLAFLMAYWFRHGLSNPFHQNIYLNEMLILVLIQLMSAVFGENFKNVFKRGYYLEFVATCKQVIIVTLFGIFYLFLVKNSEAYSRMTMLLTGGFYLTFSYPCRLLVKALLIKQYKTKEGNKSLLILTTAARAKDIIETVKERLLHEYKISGLVLLDGAYSGEQIHNIDVVANVDEVVNYVCRNWVDAIYIDVESNELLPQNILDSFNEMGVTIHLKLQGMENPYHRKQYIESIAGSTVMTFSVNDMTDSKLILKRVMDILGSIMGCILTGILTIIVGPIIYIASPGPIFFSQTRIGKNGKPFKMYKFRSMYLNAEEQKKVLVEQNDVSDGMMFKMENDPRIIKGIGHFIRKTSIDEFPQFFNVLKGDMSLVGTRPPTVDEWEKYALHHRLRMSIRPGITGLWQVSGRSDIREFEEVVKLDAEYIANWNLGLDVKIILRTIIAVVKGNGAR